MWTPSIAGVDRGPSPPLFSAVPLSPPPSYLATPRGVAQSSLPVLASNATQTSCGAPSTERATNVQASPEPTAKELNPSVSGAFQSACKPLVGQCLPICSELTPS